MSKIGFTIMDETTEITYAMICGITKKLQHQSDVAFALGQYPVLKLTVSNMAVIQPACTPTSNPVVYQHQDNPDSGVSTEILFYGVSGTPEWASMTLKHPPLVCAAPNTPLPMKAEWGSMPKGEITGSVWTILQPAGLPAFNELDMVDYCLNKAVNFLVQFNKELYCKHTEVKQLLTDNIRVLRTANVRNKPNRESIYVW